MDEESSKGKARDNANQAVLPLLAVVKWSTDHATSALEDVILYALKQNVFDVVDYEVGFSLATRLFEFSLGLRSRFLTVTTALCCYYFDWDRGSARKKRSSGDVLSWLAIYQSLPAALFGACWIRADAYGRAYEAVVPLPVFARHGSFRADSKGIC